MEGVELESGNVGPVRGRRPADTGWVAWAVGASGCIRSPNSLGLSKALRMRQCFLRTDWGVLLS